MRIFAEWRVRSAHHSLVFAFLSLLLWGADFTVNGGNVKTALLVRLGILVLLLLSAAVKWLSGSLYLNCFATYFSMVLSEVLLGVLYKGTYVGQVAGVGQHLYFFLGAVFLCWLYPIRANLLGCVVLILVPHLVGQLLVSGFPHVLYASTLVPMGVIALGLHWRIRPLLVENIRLRQEIEAAGLIDSVTGLLTMRGLEQAFQRILKLSASKPLQRFLLLIEVDGWDKCHGAYGEKAMRSLRAQIGQVIEVSFRGRDITASLEDEFVCILQHVSKEKALEIAERFRGVIADREFECAGTTTGKLKLTVSLGVASTDSKEDIKMLLNRARVGISQARAMGGNQCVYI